MNDKHEQDKEQFKRLFRQQGIINKLDQRLEILEAFLRLEHHVTVQDILDDLEDRDIFFDRDFVIDSMKLLSRFGFASKVEFDNGKICYEHRHLGLHHDHMICTRCGRILEFNDEFLEKQQLKLAEAYGFHMLQHKMEIYGICSVCMEDRKDLVRLSNAKQGEKLIIRKIEAGKDMHLRISSMGLETGSLIEIVSSGPGGQVVIALNRNRLAIGRGMAEKILVWPKVETYPRFPRERKDSGQEFVTLSRMKAGQKGVVIKVGGKNILKRRLLEMGINRGSEIHIEKYAPLKDPLEIVVKGSHISLRVEEASNITVKKNET